MEDEANTNDDDDGRWAHKDFSCHINTKTERSSADRATDRYVLGTHAVH
jgi:hypothetical protein